MSDHIAPPRLYHVSDRGDIVRFEPRPSPTPHSAVDGEVVWAVREQLLHNYLLPRDCPRVTFYSLPTSSPSDVDRMMAGTSARYVVAIETRWLEPLRRTRLYRYELPPETFQPLDEGAGYYVSRQSVIPRDVIVIKDLLAALLVHDVELRVMPSLWKLCDAVVASTLQFSVIRFRNAQPRPPDQPRILRK